MIHKILERSWTHGPVYSCAFALFVICSFLVILLHNTNLYLANALLINEILVDQFVFSLSLVRERNSLLGFFFFFFLRLKTLSLSIYGYPCSFRAGVVFFHLTRQ
ncbi:hypothetical protein MANES_03G099332v8 [Manihot esculenta]|uniref:Uncharacterized protein n=1 Tax=Manihot esculenta TaxID=3983 RepID=A0ACB7HZ93_MANES|nr:hypothetical protein MANES_03G099332v8 [Manihot esculenta]